MKVIFLDFDGVLNSLRSCIAFHGYPFPEKETWYKFDRCAIGLIRKLCKETGAKIVLSTTWRLHMSVDEVIAMFNELGFEDAPVIGRTPSYNSSNIYGSGLDPGHVRGDEINVWIAAFNRGDIAPALLTDQSYLGKQIEQYVIVDDDSDMLVSQKANFVQTSFMDGLTLESFLDMLRILDPKNKELKEIGRSIYNERPVHTTAS